MGGSFPRLLMMDDYTAQAIIRCVHFIWRTGHVISPIPDSKAGFYGYSTVEIASAKQTTAPAGRPGLE